MTNNDLQNTIQKPKDRATRTPLKTAVNPDVHVGDAVFLLHQWHPSCSSSRGHPFRGMHIAAAKLWPISIPLYSLQVCRLSWRYRIIVRFPFTNASMCLSQLILPVRFPPIPRCSRQKKNLKIPMALSEAVNRR